MRVLVARLLMALFMATPSLAQQANVSVSARSGLPNDRRPFGKYLVETCTLADEHLTLTCTEVPYPRSDSPEQVQSRRPRGTRNPCPPTVNPRPCQASAVQSKDQTLGIKLVCDPAKKDPCDPTDPKAGDDFFVLATADSGLPAYQTVLLGSAMPLGGSQTVHYRANAVGPIVIRASVRKINCGPGVETQTCNYNSAPPVDLILQVSGDSAAKSDSCPVLPPPAGSLSKPLDAPTIVTLIGNPTPFVLSAEGPNTIFIYATRLPVQGEERNILGSFQPDIAELAGRTAASLGITPASAKPFSVELKIPHWTALGDLATRIGTLNYSQFTVQDVGKGSVRVTAPAQPECATWKGFLTDVREMAWQPVSSPMSEKLYYLSSSDVATAFSGLGSPSATSAPAGGSASTAGSAASSASTTSSGASPSVATTSTATPSATSPSATIAITQPPGSNIHVSSDTTPCVVAGLAFGNTTGCGSSPASASSTSSPATTTAAAPPSPASVPMASVAVAAGTGEQSPPDLLIYSDTNPGDDAQIVERNRILAQLDLPRPEMILSAWVTQNSTASPEAMGAFNNMVKGIVADYNDEYESVVRNGWLSLKEQQHSDPYFFNEPFRSYIADRFVADTSNQSQPGRSVQQLSQDFLDQSQVKMIDPPKRTSLGICERGRYCLGYGSLFRRALLDDIYAKREVDNDTLVRPTLTDLLLQVIAAQQPVVAALTAVQDVEGDAKPVPPCGDCICESEEWSQVETECIPGHGECKREYVYRTERVKAETRKRCRAIWHNLDLDHVSLPPQKANCEELDFRGILGSLFQDGTHQPHVHLQCFKEAAEKLLVPAKCKAEDHICLAGQQHLMRMLIAPGSCEGHDSACDKGKQLLKWWADALNTAVECSDKRICEKAKENLKGLEEAETQFDVRLCIAANRMICEKVKEQLKLLRGSKASPYGVGLFRSAIADFLFNYKMSQRYPHEFVAYDLTQSANTLNNAFSPLIDAFNRDLWSYQMFVRADMQYRVEELNSRTDQRCCVKRLFGLDKPSFFNDGVVTVRTISGQPTNVSVTSQSFLNGSTAPELPALLNSLANLGGSGSGGGGSGGGSTTTAGTTTTTTTTTSGGSAASSGSGGSPAHGLFGAYGAIPAVLANYQTSFAQIGRQLSFSATPRSLATASSAEIAVTLNADESAGGPLYTGPGATDAAFNTSRVANHDTTTRVRVDSIKLFEVSSFSAIVQRSRSRFPLLPPFVEIPYIGTFAGIPLGSAKEFHSSTAIISAYVVPTAADIAYGLHFVSDLVVDGPDQGSCSFFKGAAGPDVKNVCVFREMFSLRDVGEQQPILEFNKNVTHCFATDTSSDGCHQVSFDNTLESRK
jgi:hypothetical protein